MSLQPNKTGDFCFRYIYKIYILLFKSLRSVIIIIIFFKEINTFIQQGCITLHYHLL